MRRFSAFFSSAAFVKLNEPGNYGSLINDHDLVMGYGMLAVDIGGYLHIGEKCCFSIGFLSLTLVQDCSYLNPTFIGIDKGLGLLGKR
jgi:hypothetical protein